MKPGFDWEIFNPATNNIYTISGIEKANTELKCGIFTTSCFCYDPVTRISVNNQNVIANSFKSNVLFLQK